MIIDSCHMSLCDLIAFLGKNSVALFITRSFQNKGQSHENFNVLKQIMY